MKSWVWLYRHYLTYVYHWIHACITNGTAWFTWSFYFIFFLFPHPPTTPSHYLNQCWHIVNWNLGNKFQWNLNEIFFFSFEKMGLKMVVNWPPFLFWPQCVKHIQNDEILSMTVQTLSYLCVPLNSCLYYQWHSLIYLKFLFYIFSFPTPTY